MNVVGYEELVEAEPEEDIKLPEPREEPFFAGVDAESIIPQFSKNMLRLLSRYRERQSDHIRQQIELEKLLREKPDPNKDNIDDIRLIEEAKKNLGVYVLKTDPNYEPAPTDTLVHKYDSIIKCREKIIDIQTSYNNKLLKAREDKKKMYANIEEMRRRFEFIHRLIPKKNHKEFPKMREINIEKEWPDDMLKLDVPETCGIDIKDIIFNDEPIKNLRAKWEKTKPEPELTIEEKNDLERYTDWSMHEVEFVPSPEEIAKIYEELPKVETLDDLEYWARKDTPTSPIIVAKRLGRLLELLHEQDKIILNVNGLIEDFDNNLEELMEGRLLPEFQVERIESLMITMNMELNILKDSEEIEKKLKSKAQKAMSERNAMQTKLNLLNRQIEEIRKNGEKINEQIKTLQATFLDEIKGNHFFDFLRRIFKKKYKPPKKETDDDESSESSSSDESSSDEEDIDDDRSIDSTDLTVIRLDEDTCPEGCDRQLYDMAIRMRAESHKLEQEVYQQQKAVEAKRVEVEKMKVEMKECDDFYAKQKEKLVDFRRKRQQELNKIPITVVLRSDQIQHFKEGEDWEDFSNAILFKTDDWIRLQKRVGELKEEDKDIKRLHRLNIVHYHRLNNDIAHLRREITRLETEIKEAMIMKFGKIVDLDQLEEEVLKRHVQEIIAKNKNQSKYNEKNLPKLKAELAALQEEIIRETRIQTEKINIITVLKQDISALKAEIKDQDNNYDKLFNPNTFDIEKNIEEMEKFDREQEKEIKLVEAELEAIRIKTQFTCQPENKVEDEVKDKDDKNLCPELSDAEKLELIPGPDESQKERIEQRVHRFFVRHFARVMTENNIQKYEPKVAKYLGLAGFRIQCDLTDIIMECIIEHLQMILPKKYLQQVTSANWKSLVNEVLDVLDYERSDTNIEELLPAIFACAIEVADSNTDSLNKTQIILEEIFQQLIEIMPREDFTSETTLNKLVELLRNEKRIVPKCIAFEKLVNNTVKYAQENKLDLITTLPIRKLAENICKELGLVKSKPKETVACSVSQSKCKK